MWQRKLNKFIFNFFYKKRYTSFEYLLLGVVIGIALDRQFLLSVIIFVLGMFGSAIFQTLAEGVRKYRV